MDNQNLDKKLTNAQNELKLLNQMIQQMRGKPEFAADLTNMNRLQQLAQHAEQEIQNVKSSSSMNMEELIQGAP